MNARMTKRGVLNRRRLCGRGIDRNLYEANVSFEDPLTKYDSIEGYLFNIGMLKNVFKPTYTMHSIEQTGDWELTTRRGTDGRTSDAVPVHYG